MPAPVVLFVYNRPEHTRRTLASLAANPLARESTLYVYADGPKHPADAPAIEAVRAIVQARDWCGAVHLQSSATNRGLAASIIAGVTERLAEEERIIVLEDDLELAPGFLAYMNRALELYADDARVMQISGYLPELDLPLPATLFLRTASSWGWATWRRAWLQLRTDAPTLLREVERAGQVAEFNLDGGYPYLDQLRLNAEGRLRTWAILWYATVFLADGLVLHPGRPLVRNIGHDATGTNSRPDARFDISALAGELQVERIPLEPHSAARAAMRERYGSTAPRAPWWRRLLRIVQARGAR